MLKEQFLLYVNSPSISTELQPGVWTDSKQQTTNVQNIYFLFLPRWSQNLQLEVQEFRVNHQIHFPSTRQTNTPPDSISKQQNARQSPIHISGSMNLLMEIKKYIFIVLSCKSPTLLIHANNSLKKTSWLCPPLREQRENGGSHYLY